MSADPSQAAEEKAGALYAGSAYVLWGALPLYWRMLGHVSAVELTAHRIVWCTLSVAIVTVARGHLLRILRAVRQPGMLRTLALSSLLISVNWTIYIYCIETDQLVEASLGYFINPLLSFALGYFFFGERMSPIRMAAAAFAMLAVIAKTIAVGHVSWIAPSLAVTFCLYGFIRKRAVIPALDGLLVETTLMFPLAVAYLVWLGAGDNGVFTTANPLAMMVLIVGGPITAIPLSLFAAGVRRARMTTIGFLQYLSPSITLVLAVFGFGEAFTRADAVTFACVWAALMLVAAESLGWIAVPMRLFARSNNGASLNVNDIKSGRV